MTFTNTVWLRPTLMLTSGLTGKLSGWVQIANVSSQTSGQYRCSASNKLHTQSCYLNLDIYTRKEPPPPTHTHTHTHNQLLLRVKCVSFSRRPFKIMKNQFINWLTLNEVIGSIQTR